MGFAMAHAEATKRKAGKGGPPPSRRGLTRSGEVRAAPTAVYSRVSFCVAHGISEAFYAKLQNEGLGPDEMRLGSRVFITHESAARWRAAREAATAVATEKATMTA
jgi:hypothetical protein